MTVSQQINLVDQSSNLYDIDITVTDVPSGHFTVTTNNQVSSGSSTREITIDILLLPQAPGGTSTISSGIIERVSGETSIKVTVKKDGNVLATNTSNY